MIEITQNSDWRKAVRQVKNAAFDAQTRQESARYIRAKTHWVRNGWASPKLVIEWTEILFYHWHPDLQKRFERRILRIAAKRKGLTS